MTGRLGLLRIAAATAAVALAAVLAACSAPVASGGTAPAPESSPMVDQMGDETTDDMAEPMAELSGTFAGLNGKHVEGSVTVTDTSIALSGFASDEGPDLHVYLTNGTDEAAVAAGTEIGLVAYDQAAQTFDLSGVDVAGFTDVVIHCDKASAVFGAASLS